MHIKHIRLLAWIYLFILVLGSTLPLNNGTRLNNTFLLEVRSDYLLHVLMLLPLPVLLGLSLRPVSGKWILVIFLALGMVIFCESVQLFIPYRAFNINDMAANGIGALIGLFPAVLFWRRFSASAK